MKQKNTQETLNSTCCKSHEELEAFLPKALELLKKGKTVTFSWKGHTFTMNKNNFIISKDGEVILENYLEKIVFNFDFYEIVFNPYTNRSVHVDAPKILYDFFEDYFYLIRNERATTRNKEGVRRTSEFFLFASDITLGILWLVTFFGFLALFWYLDAKCFQSISNGRMVIEGLVALIVAEFVYDFVRSKLM